VGRSSTLFLEARDFLHPRLFQLGPLVIPTSGLLAAVAILAALYTARVAGRRLGLDPERLWDLGILGVLVALVSPRVLLILANWNDFRAHPLWMIGVVNVRSQAATLGGLTVAIAVVLLYIQLTRLPLRPTLDAIAPALALGLAIDSLGDLAAGSHFGTLSSLPWAVTYTSRLASLWSGTPLGTPLHPVQIYTSIAELCLFALLMAMIATRARRKLRDGEIMGAWLFLSGLASFTLSFLRGDLAATGPYLGAQVLAASMVLVGGLLWLL